VERGGTAAVLAEPVHDYTRKLLRSVLHIGTRPDWAAFAA